jgi:NADH-quinone oxidoreductase subunit J
MPVALQIILSYCLVAGLVVGVGALVMSSLARFLAYRRVLGIIALLGFALFYICMMALTRSGLRLINTYYWLFTAAIVGGGIGTVTMRNVFHAALMLILSLFGVAGYFVLVNAEFLAMVQVIIYIGGIMVLFLFGIMVSQNILGQEVRQNSPETPWAAISAGLLFAFMGLLGLFMSFPRQEAAGTYVLQNNTQSIGWSLMGTFTLPFEVASVLLLMAMLGAIILVRKD